jgi:hypothetical protein
MNGRVRCEGEVVRLVPNHLTDLSDDGFPLPHGRGDEFHHGNPRIDPRSLPPQLPKPQDICGRIMRPRRMVRRLPPRSRSRPKRAQFRRVGKFDPSKKAVFSTCLVARQADADA